MFINIKKLSRNGFFKRLIYLLLVIVAKSVLECVYIFFIHPRYEYMGLILNISQVRFIESYFILIILYFLMPIDRYSIVGVFLNMQYLITIIPILSFYCLTSQSRTYLYAVVLCHTLQCFISNISIKKILDTHHKLQLHTVYILILLFSILLLGYCVHRYGMPTWSAFDFNNVYVIRQQNTWIFPLTYLIPWYAKIIFPLGIILAIKNKRYIISALLLVCFIGIYLLFPNKAFIFSLALIILVYLAVKFRILYYALYGMLPLVLVGGVLEKMFFKSTIIISYLIRRALIVPAQLKFAYYNYFSTNEKYYYAMGRIGKLFGIKTDYTKSIPVVVGEYTGTSGYANTGYLGESYAQIGFIGLFILAILLILFLKTLDTGSRNISTEVALSVSVFWIYTLNDSALLTALLTGGGLLFLVFFFVFKESGAKNRKT